MQRAVAGRVPPAAAGVQSLQQRQQAIEVLKALEILLSNLRLWRPSHTQEVYTMISKGANKVWRDLVRCGANLSPLSTTSMFRAEQDCSRPLFLSGPYANLSSRTKLSHRP